MWLGSGKVSVLYQELVERQKLAVDVKIFYDETQVGPGTLTVRIVPRDGVSIATLEAAVDATLASALQAGPDPESLARAKTLYRASITYAQDGLGTIASYIGALMMVGKDEEFFYGLPDIVDAAKAEEMQAVAKRVLVKSQSVTGVLLPAPAEAVADDTLRALPATVPEEGLP